MPAGQYQLFAEIQDTIAGVTYTAPRLCARSITVPLANPTPTTTTTTNVYSSLDPSTYGQSVTYTAIVSREPASRWERPFLYRWPSNNRLCLTFWVASWTPPGTLLDSADPANDWA